MIYYFTYFSTIIPSNICAFLSCSPFVVIQHFQQVLWALKFLLPPGLGSWQFESLIIVIVSFQNFVSCLAWDWSSNHCVERSLYIGSFCPAMTSMSIFGGGCFQYFDRSTAQAKQQTKIQNLKTNNYNSQLLKLKLSTAQARRQK